MGNIIKASGFQFSEFGDLVLASTLCRTFKELYPDSFLTFCCHNKYSNILPLFYNFPYCDGFHLWDGKTSENWPTEKDLKFIRTQDLAFTAKPQHKDNLWYIRPGALMVDEIHDMYGLPQPLNKQAYLERWFDLLSGYDKVITASVYASGNHPNQLARTFSIDKIIEIFDGVEKLGYKIVRLDTRIEPKLELKYPASQSSILNATQQMLSSKLHITCDTSFGHIASAYSHNTISWVQYEAYNHANPNGHCFISEVIDNIPVEQIIGKIKEKIQ